jgi:DNA helicase-2/ATP-dependent DNA helicase PcrA
MQLITAPPGAGKTRRLVSDIQERLQQGVSPYTIIATTFTREAAREISDRLGNEVPIRTLHGLGHWIIRLSRQTRGERVPRIVSEDKSLAIMERAIKELDAKYIEPRQALDDMARVRERGGRQEALHPRVQEIIGRYMTILRADNLLDFTGLLDEARRELESPDLREFLRGQRVFVDEGQDVNPQTEWPILEVLRQGASEFVMFASPSQQIYGFRGASWEKLCNQFPDDLRVESMRENYRSTPEIVRTAARLAGPDAEAMVAVRESIGSEVAAVDALNPEVEADYVGRQVSEWLGKGVTLEEVAVLTRVHTMLNAVQMALRARDIPFQIVGGRRSIFQREETEAALGYLGLALDPMDDGVLEAIIDFPPCGIGIRTRHDLRGDGRLTWDHLLQALADPKRFRPQAIRRILQIIDLRERYDEVLAARLPPLQTISRLLELSEIPSYLNGEGDFQAARSVNDLVAASIEFGSLKTYVEYLQDEVTRPRDAEGIQLSTLHAAKGREYDAVIIPGFHEGLIPLDGADLTEERNLAFVGMTRPRFHLTLTLNRSKPPSQFLAKLPVHVSGWPAL